nr:hypothetical protein [uncultured Criibacterium sp.]
MRFTRYIYHNQNPKNLQRAADCVFRATSFAFGITWEQALRELTQVALQVKDAPNSKRVLEKYLKLKGLEKQKQPVKSNNKKYKVREFCNKFSTGTFIVKTARHLTVVKDGYIYDTWDCGEKCVGNYWRVSN